MIVLFHIICCIFSELSTPAWQNEVRQITFQCVEAMEEAKKKYRLRMTPCSLLTIDRSLKTNLVVSHILLFASLRDFLWWKKTCCEFIEHYFFCEINAG